MELLDFHFWVIILLPDNWSKLNALQHACEALTYNFSTKSVVI